ncbi:MAG: ATP-binding protein [Magnetococcales bacterium]|nr:ATP-binding protein [Magnetococcales bacterium]
MDPQQFILDFPIDPVCDFDNFVVDADNQWIVDALQQSDNAKATCVTIVGEAGIGKTHLLQAAVHDFHVAHGQDEAVYLDLNRLADHLNIDSGSTHASEEALTQFLSRFGNHGLVAIDELERLETSPALQEGVLFLFNMLRQKEKKMICAGRTPPNVLIGLRDDLRTRLLWGPVLTLKPPSEEVLVGILGKMADDRQVRVSEDVLRFLCRRLPRCVPDHAEALAKLDQEALRLKRPLTIPLAKKILHL